MKKKKDVFNSNLRKKTTLLGIKPGSKNKKYYLVAVDYALFISTGDRMSTRLSLGA